MKRRVAILISGRGSNMAALIQAAAAEELSGGDRGRDLQPRGRGRIGKSGGDRRRPPSSSKATVRQGSRGVRGGLAGAA